MAIWLLVCAFLTASLVVVGGITRLTHSGLSIVEWEPLVGAVPPLNDHDWQELFSEYQSSPQYKLVNTGMTLAEFKGIFWWEYVHRLLGRIIGIVFIVPLVWFIVRRRIDRPLALKLFGVFLLGGLQGALGWWMVKSGLVDDPAVSQYRLVAHLGLALLILGAELSIAFGLLLPRAADLPPARASLAKAASHLARLVFVTALAGGFVAGIHAGLAFNTFPLMDGGLVPPGMFALEPWWKNFFENVATVQFDHRLLAWLTALGGIATWLAVVRSDAPRRGKRAAHLLLAAVLFQFVLGVVTLLRHAHPHLAATHQAGAVLLFAAAIWAGNALRSQ